MTIRAGAEPFAHRPAGRSRIGVLLLHGFTGSPAAVRPWGQFLAGQGLAVEVPLLPGHGTSWRALNRTTWQDWYAEAERAFLGLREHCDEVLVMGLSMGGTLSLRLAEVHGTAVAGLVLVNPAVHTERRDAALLPLLARIVPSFPAIGNDIKREGVDEIAYPRLPLRAAQSLSRLWGVVRAEIGQVTQPLLLLRSEVDHVVEPSNARWILSHVHSVDITVIVLPNSFHVATLDNDAPTIHRESVSFISRVTGWQPDPAGD
ncbi:MAG: alpha/beta fold hydrolase [Actinomycetales bacterium]|nr:alpha/beta fold hydrolase [Actinomycetales bacterium]